jgi:hypothetical protein
MASVLGPLSLRCGLSLARLWPCHREHIRNRLWLAKPRPCFHELAPLFQGVAAAPVGPLRGIARDMRQRGLGKFPRERRCLTAPIPERASEPMHRHVNIHPAKHRNFSTNSASLAQGVSTRTLRVSLSAVKSLSPKLGVDGRLGRPCDVRGLARLVFRMYRDGAKPVIGANRVPLRLKIRRGIVAQRRAPPREPGTANRPTCYEGQISLFPANYSQASICAIAQNLEASPH